MPESSNHYIVLLMTGNVVLYDESCLQIYRADGRIHIWRQPHESMEPTCQQRVVQVGRISEVVWSVCSWLHMGPLIHLQTILAGNGCVSILSDHLHLFISIAHSDGLGHFQQKNAAPSSSRVASKCLQEHSSDFRHYQWIPKSSDTNIIVHISDALQLAVQKRSLPPRIPAKLWAAMQRFMVRIANRKPEDISQVHETLCCDTFVCLWKPTRYHAGVSVFLAFESIIFYINKNKLLE